MRIYNRQRILTWMQDVEFGVYGCLFQAGRNDWGTAGMGGNGQFNRLRALDDVTDAGGPWRDRLTEDQDLGLRLVAAGWSGRQELRARVDQQGLPGLRRLLRQRTRWSQGNLQAMGLVGDLIHAPFTKGARLELLAYLLMPLWQGIIGAAFLTAIALTLFDIAPFWNDGPSWQLPFFYLLAFGGTILGCIAARRSDGPRGWAMGFLIANVYTFYTWLLWPVLLRSTVRQVTERDIIQPAHLLYHFVFDLLDANPTHNTRDLANVFIHPRRLSKKRFEINFPFELSSHRFLAISSQPINYGVNFFFRTPLPLRLLNVKRIDTRKQ